jgi:ribosomal protein S8E
VDLSTGGDEAEENVRLRQKIPAAVNHIDERELKMVKIENLFYNLKSKNLIDRNNLRG